MTENENKEKNENKKQQPTKMRLSLGIVVGVYLLYLAYGLFGNLGNYEGTEKLFFAAFTCIFAIAGGILVFFAGKKLAKGEYDKGDMPE